MQPSRDHPVEKDFFSTGWSLDGFITPFGTVIKQRESAFDFIGYGSWKIGELSWQWLLRNPHLSGEF